MMLKSASNFIAANEEALIRSNEMPPTFPEDFNAVVNDFRKLLSDYENIKENNQVVGRSVLPPCTTSTAILCP